MNNESNYTIITHTDMDGIGSASIYIYLQNEKPSQIIFTEPYLLDKALNHTRRMETGRIAIMDLGINPVVIEKIFETIKDLRKRGVEIEWYDHHVWDQKWIDKLASLGVKLFVDRSTCATGVVAKYSPHRRREIDHEFLEEVVNGVCAGDLWRFDHWRGPWYIRLVRRRDDHRWRLHVIDVISSGRAWSDEFTDIVVKRIEIELKEYKRLGENFIVGEVNGFRIAVAPASRVVDNSFLAAFVMGRTDADIVAIASNDGKISLRSRRVNVREIAVKMGGGGHPRASGAKIKIPLSTRIMALFDKKRVLKRVFNVIAEALNGFDREDILLVQREH